MAEAQSQKKSFPQILSKVCVYLSENVCGVPDAYKALGMDKYMSYNAFMNLTDSDPLHKERINKALRLQSYALDSHIKTFLTGVISGEVDVNTNNLKAMSIIFNMLERMMPSMYGKQTTSDSNIELIKQVKAIAANMLGEHVDGEEDEIAQEEPSIIKLPEKVTTIQDVLNITDE